MRRPENGLPRVWDLSSLNNLNRKGTPSLHKGAVNVTDRKGCEQSEMGLGVAPDNAKMIRMYIANGHR